MICFIKRLRRYRAAGLAVVALLGVARGAPAGAAESDDPAWRAFQHARGEPAMIGANASHTRAESAYRPVPDADPQVVEPVKFRLGSDLFHEGRLSSADSVACVTCHAGALSGADRRRVSTGVDGALGRMNALSVFNATFNFRQFWDGRAVTLEDQALEPIQTEFEMASTLEQAVRTLREDSVYAERFRAVYPDGVTVGNMADAMAHFQRINFVRRDTPFQRFLDGDGDALDEQAERGWRRFDAIGCASCHNGINLGGNSYQKLGAAVPYYGEEREATGDDAGVMTRSGRERDRHMFRVPGLHGVATTPPYFHDGSVETLQAAIREMGEHQLGRDLPKQDVEDIEAFLRSLGTHFTGGGAAGMPGAGEAQDEGGTSESVERLSHEQAYQASIDAIGEAREQLLAEAGRIRSGKVAHYDFLQFQHRELIRHARALHHPPSALPRERREALAQKARRLLSTVNDLEWMISDFLRAEAMIGVMTAHREAPADNTLHNGDRGIDTRLADYLDRSERAMEKMASIDINGLLPGLR